MTTPLHAWFATTDGRLAPFDDAPQHRPRPLPLLLAMLRSETEGDEHRRAAALAGLRAYQSAPRPDRPAWPDLPTIASAGRARLVDFGGEGRPAIFVPSLVNGAQVLDIIPEHSMLRWLSEQGVRPLLIDWGTPDPAERELSIGGHVEQMLHPLLRGIGGDAALVGYCLGGTMAIAAATLACPNRLALIATPWRFSGFGDDARAAMRALWDSTRGTAETMGLLPLEVLQAGFWQLDPTRTIDKFAAFGRAGPSGTGAERFVAVEDWANGGPPLTLAAARELFESLIGRDASGSGEWTVADRPIDPARIGCPILDIVSSNDRIVPAASAAGVGTTLRLAQGHVGMVVGNHAREALWEPLARWLRAEP